MHARSVEVSPQTYARLGGVLYLMIIALGLFSEGFVAAKLIAPGDAAATAQNIIASPALWRASVAGNLLIPLCAVVLVWIFYLLFRPVDKQLVMLAVFLNLVSLAVESISKLFLLAAAPVLSRADYLRAFEPAQLEVLANFSLRLHDVAFNIALIFFGCACLVNGRLIFRSGFLPRLIGVLMQLAGLSYLIACFAVLFAPALGELITPAILLPALVGESSLCLWLLIKGVDVVKWKAQAASA